MRRALAAALVLLALTACGTAPRLDATRALDRSEANARVSPGTFTSSTYEGATYKVLVPSSYRASKALPMVVMLHGCVEDPDNFALGTRMNAIAEQEGFIALYPQQTTADNPKACWNWFDPRHQFKIMGEPALIHGMIEQVKSRLRVDPKRVYATGMSAGGCEAIIMAATYPETFAAIGVHSGVAYRSAKTDLDAWDVMAKGGPDPLLEGTAIAASWGFNAHVMPVIAFHGEADPTVAQVNVKQIISQWALVNDLAIDGLLNGDVKDTPSEVVKGQVSGGRAYRTMLFKDRGGSTVLEEVLVSGMGHAWSGGDPKGSYTDPQGPDASRMMWEFFRAHPRK